MKAVLSAGWRAALVSGLIAGGCGAQAPAVTEGQTPQTGDVAAPNKPVPLSITCGEFIALLKSGDKRTGGLAILWLDGYYAGRSGLAELAAGWVRTVSQGVGGTCGIGLNQRRTVLDVIAQMHREYGGDQR